MELRHTKNLHADPVKLAALLMPPHPTAAEVARIDFDRVARTIPDTNALRAGFLAWSLDERLSTTAACFDIPVSRIQVALCDLRHRIAHVEHEGLDSDPPNDIATRLGALGGDWDIWSTWGQSSSGRSHPHPSRRFPVVDFTDFAAGKVRADITDDLAGRLVQAASYDICNAGRFMVTFSQEAGEAHPELNKLLRELRDFVSAQIIEEADYYYFSRHMLTVKAAVSVLRPLRCDGPICSTGQVPDAKRAALHEKVTESTARLLHKLGINDSVARQKWDGFYGCIDVVDLLAAVRNELCSWKEAARAITEPIEYLHLRWALADKKLLQQPG